jgi:hypothetical protein
VGAGCRGRRAALVLGSVDERDRPRQLGSVMLPRRRQSPGWAAASPVLPPRATAPEC